MTKKRIVTLLGLLLPIIVLAQTANEDGLTESNLIKRIDKDASYGAYNIEKSFEFFSTRGADKNPIPTAKEKGKVEMASIKPGTFVGYMLSTNSFLDIADYDFEIFYGSKFKSQKYPPYKIPLTSDDIFFDDNYGLLYGYKANEEGQRCRFSYQYNYSDAKYLTRVFFHQEIPATSVTYTFKIPSNYTIDIAEKNFKNYKVIKNTETDKNGNTLLTYSMQNLPPVGKEGSSLARAYYLPHLVITVKKFVYDKMEYEHFTNVADMYKWYNYLYSKADNKTDVLKTQVSSLTEGKTSQEEKAKSIYYWVQDNIRYIAYEEGYAAFVPHTVQEVFQNKYGDCKGMANLLTEMLKLAGFDAHFAWIGTKDIPYQFSEVFSICSANHAITVLYMNGKTYFLDGTEKYGSINSNAYRIQGKEVLVQNGDSYKLEKVPAAKIEDNIILTNTSLRLENGKMLGHIKYSFDGNAKSFFHYIYNNIPANNRKEFIKGMLSIKESNTEVSNMNTSDFKNRDITLVIEGDVAIENEVTKAGNVWYMGIDFFPPTITGFYPDKDRKAPYDMNEMFVSDDKVTLQLPEGGVVRSLPNPLTAKLSNNEINATYTQEGNTVVLNKKLSIADPVIFQKDFTEWKDFLNKIKNFNQSNLSITIK